ncbi:hypothetical protein ES703_111799 [subsurface metagenome]
MTRISLIIFLSIGCPATLLAQTASTMKNPPMAVTATTGTPNTNTPRISAAPTSVAKPLVNTEQTNKLNTQNRNIQDGMSAAKERYDQAHSAATNSMVTGVVSGTAQIGTVAGTGVSRSVNSAAAPIDRTGAAKTDTSNMLNGTTAKKSSANNQEVNANRLQAEADKADLAKKASADRANQTRTSIQKMLDTQKQMRPCATC